MPEGVHKTRVFISRDIPEEGIRILALDLKILFDHWGYGFHECRQRAGLRSGSQFSLSAKR